MSDVATEHSAVAIRSAGLTSLKTDAEEETPSPANHVDEADEEEDAPNWLAFANYAKTAGKSKSTEPVIPKRGEKDFEPAKEERHVNLQVSLLEASRTALYTAIGSGVRSHSSKAHNRAVWDPSVQRAYMVEAPNPALPPSAEVNHSANFDAEGNRSTVPATAHGIHFSTMGRYNAARKRLELLPEEILYLLERGTVECWTSEHTNAVPLSVQHAWAIMLQSEGMSAERYQIYAYLRRLGYTVIRANDELAHAARNRRLAATVTQRSASIIEEYLIRPMRSLLSQLWYTMRQQSSFLHPTLVKAQKRLRNVTQGYSKSLIGGQRWLSYDQLFTAMQLVTSGKEATISPPESRHNPYEPVFYVYKPITKFKKTDPPEPDFRIAVINAQTTPIPDIYDFCNIFQNLPAEPLLLPSSNRSKPPPNNKTPSDMQNISLFLRIWYRMAGQTETPSNSQSRRIPSLTRPAPYGRLKAGKKTSIIAVVDNGTVSFQKFGETDFAELPWVGNGTA